MTFSIVAADVRSQVSGASPSGPAEEFRPA